MRASILLPMMIALAACGTSDGSGYQAPAPSPPPPSQTPVVLQWADVAPVIAKNCGQCHNGTQEPAYTEANFKASNAKAMIESGAMPKPPATISAQDKATLLAYLNEP